MSFTDWTDNLCHVPDQRIAKWTRWIEGTIKHNVLSMHLQRMAWRDVSEILAANDDLPDSYWWEFMRDTYATTQAIAVRRQADTMRGVASLAKLIDEISHDPSRLTWEWWRQLTGDDPDDVGGQRLLRENWDKHFAGAIGEHLDAAIPLGDLAELTAVGTSVREYVDKHVAHAEASPPEVTLTLTEVHDAIDVIGHLFKKYSNLLTGAGWVFLEPVIQHNWKAAFTIPWMKT